MVLSTQVDGVYIHASIIGPVVCEGNDQLYARVLRSCNHLVERLQIDGLRPIVPKLEHDVGFSRTFTSIIR